jgi:chlorite dismutase
VNNRYSFLGGSEGAWRVVRMSDVRGAGLAVVDRLQVVQGPPPTTHSAIWTLQGLTSNVRYATRDEVDTLKASQPALDRPQATCAALIPITKSAQWWELAQDERRTIFEQTSRHTAIGLDYLPAIARRLHHCRDIGEPFDFLTWFEYAPCDAGAFDELVARLRATREWDYVVREVDIRLERVEGQRDAITTAGSPPAR